MTDKSRTRPFHERFGIEVGTAEARLRFINRVENSIFESFIPTVNKHGGIYETDALTYKTLFRSVAYFLGITLREIPTLRGYVGNDFLRCLRVLEALYAALETTHFQDELSNLIEVAVRASEIDLGITWQPPIFVPTGARLLDERLVNDPLHWLPAPEYERVRKPFEKGLSHFLESENKPHLLADVITDMYESVEALSRIVTGRHNKDLSANREIFISKVKVSEHYKKLLKDYIDYANEFRHAEQEQKPRPSPSRAEVESFIYLTGLFIRLGVQQS